MNVLDCSGRVRVNFSPAPTAPMASCVRSRQEVIELVRPFHVWLFDPLVPNADRANELYARLVMRVPMGVSIRDCRVDDARRTANFTIEDAAAKWSIPFGLEW